MIILDGIESGLFRLKRIIENEEGIILDGIESN